MNIFRTDWLRRAEALTRAGKPAQAGEAYLKAKRPRLAARAFSDGGDVDRAVAVMIEAGLTLDAADLYADADRPREAVALYEAAGSYRRAAEAAIRGGQPGRAARLLENAGQLVGAADLFVESGELDHAVRALERETEALRTRRDATRDLELEQRIAGLDERRADYLEKLQRPREAAGLWQRLDRPKRAAMLFEQAGASEDAARAWHDAGEDTRAFDAIRNAERPDPELAAVVYLHAGETHRAAEMFESLGKLDAAAAAYEDARAWAHAAALWKRIGSFARAGELFARVERHYDAAQCFASDGQHDRAGEAFLRADAVQFAADAYATAGDPLRAGELYLEAGLPEAAREMLLDVPADADSYLDASILLVPMLLDVGEDEEAERRLVELRDRREELERHTLLYVQARGLEARGNLSGAARYYEMTIARRRSYRDALDRLERLRERLAAAPSLRESGRLGAAGQSHGASTQRVRLHPSDAETSEISAPAGLAEPQPAADPAATPSHGLSMVAEPEVTLHEPIEPWWSGSEFHRATDDRDGREVFAVTFSLAEVVERIDGFRYVMRQVAALRHKAVLELHETLLARDRVLLLYEPFDGRTLLSRLGDDEDFGTEGALHVIIQLCEALHDAHKLGVTHQWLSPRTVLVRDDRRVKLAGLGLREFLADPDPTAHAYLSPEVVANGVIGPASDIFSLGLLALELLGAALPAVHGTEYDPSAVRWPPEVAERVPPPLRRILVACLAHDPLARPTIAELAAAFAALGFVDGQVLGGRYEITGELGRGGMSRVYRAIDRELGGEVAIKTVLDARGENEERLLREVQISRRISHPRVVRVHDLGRFPGGIFIIMELLEGPGLDEVIERDAPLSLHRTRRLMIEIAQALGEAHRLGIVHRDLKPGNVILVDDHAKVLDFGIARSNDQSNLDLTRTGEVIGSPLFMAPEQIQGRPLDGTCDLYALGVIAFTMLTGREPFNADTPTAVVLQHLHEAPPDIRAFRSSLPASWIELLHDLLAKKPEDRPADAETLIHRLEALDVVEGTAAASEPQLGLDDTEIDLDAAPSKVASAASGPEAQAVESKEQSSPAEARSLQNASPHRTAGPVAADDGASEPSLDAEAPST